MRGVTTEVRLCRPNQEVVLSGNKGGDSVNKKICTKCQREKDVEQFSLIISRGKRCLSARCKDCVSEYKREHYLKNRDKYLDKAKAQRERDPEGYKAYMREYHADHSEELKQKHKEYMSNEKARELRNLTGKRYRETSEGKFKERVRHKVLYALQKGYLKKPDKCSICGVSVKVEAHHEDYNKPLEVIWLCKSCHENIHHLNEGRKSS